MYTHFAIAILLLPILGFIISLLARNKPQFVGSITTVLMAIVAVMALITSWQFYGQSAISQPLKTENLYPTPWLTFGSGQLSIDFGMKIDSISVMMLLVVSIVSLMVHLFSIWYMKGENRYAIYFGYLQLFTFSMLGLVVSVNLIQLYMFWELVGVSSFLLIGFYYQKASAIAAAKKAFIVTRFADFAFLIGILILSYQAGSLNISTIIERLHNPGNFSAHNNAIFWGIPALHWALALIFIGGAGKSAMFPLHIWLPDAMEGPTPVSALIHAATMVVAGVYLIARLFAIFIMAAPVMDLIMYTGLISAMIAALIACVQTDIKRILAFSTMSQIGFMMFSLGACTAQNTLGFQAAMFHLFTHAFFKSLLFLAAGAIIHQVHTNHIFSMGGLRKTMPFVHAVFLLGCLAIAGIPPFAGFFSKETILMSLHHEHPVVYRLALATATLTAFYMFRLYFVVFWNKQANHLSHHARQSATMQIPLIVLATASAGAGLLTIPGYFTPNNQFYSLSIHFQQALLPVALSVAGIVAAALLYAQSDKRAAALANTFNTPYRILYKKLYIDELYLFITQKIIINQLGKLAAWFDKHVVDGLVVASGTLMAIASDEIKVWQSGKVQQYILFILYGLIVLIVALVWMLHLQ